MNKFKAKKNPSLVLHTRDYLFQELQAWRELIKGEWPWMLMLVAGVSCVAVLRSHRATQALKS